MLISSGDDVTYVFISHFGFRRARWQPCRVRLWCMAKDDTEDYPFQCATIIQTGHSGNVFNAQMLPHSSRMCVGRSNTLSVRSPLMSPSVTVSGDSQVRVFDHEKATGFPGSNGETEYSTRQATIRILRCHGGRTKRIVTEDSPDLFLTVAEVSISHILCSLHGFHEDMTILSCQDGTVRQHDLRVPHSCNGGSCPAPLVSLNCELSTLALSPLTPYQFVVGGESPYVSPTFCQLFDTALSAYPPLHHRAISLIDDTSDANSWRNGASPQTTGR